MSSAVRSWKEQQVWAATGAVGIQLFNTPLDVVKTRAQLGGVKANAHAIGRQLVHIARVEGFAGLYHGLKPSVMLGVPSSLLYLNTYSYLKNCLEDGPVNEQMLPLVCGCVARVFTACMFSPLDVIRTRMLSQTGPARTSTVGMARRLFPNPSLLFRGLGPTFLRDVPFSAVYWTCVEQLKQNELSSFASGGISGAVAAILTTPADVAKTMAQVGHGDVYKAIDKQGWKILFRGLPARLCRIVPSCALMLWLYD
mmetsp:Transcript_4357/g.6473  ORF Transcript_4357/g.6473 Transcript_4357/m.6473 type:complete len:254 (+) Transcript_4357:150-911(+)